jgi:hypothetical protein
VNVRAGGAGKSRVPACPLLPLLLLWPTNHPRLGCLIWLFPGPPLRLDGGPVVVEVGSAKNPKGSITIQGPQISLPELTPLCNFNLKTACYLMTLVIPIQWRKVVSHGKCSPVAPSTGGPHLSSSLGCGTLSPTWTHTTPSQAS